MGDLPSLFSLQWKLSGRQDSLVGQCGAVEPSASSKFVKAFCRHLTNRLCVVPCYSIPSRLKPQAEPPIAKTIFRFVFPCQDLFRALDYSGLTMSAVVRNTHFLLNEAIPCHHVLEQII